MNRNFRQIVTRQRFTIRILPLLHDIQRRFGALLRVGDLHGIAGRRGVQVGVAVRHLKARNLRLLNDVIVCIFIQTGEFALPVVASVQF